MRKSSPWGQIQTRYEIAPGILSVSTASHGGVLLSQARNVLIPEYMRMPGCAYEEDCDWCIPAIVFEQEWRAWANSSNWTTGDFQMECAWKTLKNWHPDAYEKFTGMSLQVGESYVRDDRDLKNQTRDQFVVTATWGDWHKAVPTGMVGVAADRASDGNRKYFLILAEEYHELNMSHGSASCFVCTPGRHFEVTPFN